jgi:DNA primase
MAGKIPQSFIDDLLSRADIVEVINPRVPLKRAGPEYKACCPFHDEKTPSFTVSPSKQFYHCFGCGAHGTAVGFLMEYDHLSFPEAIEELASSLGLEVPREDGVPQGPDHRPLYDMLELAAKHFGWQLRHHPDAARAIDYLKQRGLSGEIAAEYRIGFAPPGWDNLLQALGKSAKDIERLRDAGLISEHDGKRYDRLRDRIVFPIRDNRGRVVGFGGRILSGDSSDKSAPKYLNSPETPVFHKGRELYGLYEARQALKELDRLLVVEGYMDVVALAQHGIRNAVATLGTATTADHLDRLYRVTPEVVFCFDGDRAGRDAAWKALNTALPLMRDGRQARFLFLPEGEDPDSLVRAEGADAFRQRLSRATPLSEFLLDKLAEQVDMGSLDGRARLAELARPLLARLPGGTFHEMLEQRLAEVVGLQPRTATSPPAGPTYKYKRPGATARGTIPPLRRAVVLLLQCPEVAGQADLPDGWQALDSTGIPLLRDLLETLHHNPDIGTAALVERWQDPDTRRHLARLATLELETLDDAAEQFRGALSELARQARKAQREKLQQSYRPSTMSDEEKQRLRELYRPVGAQSSTPSSGGD